MGLRLDEELEMQVEDEVYSRLVEYESRTRGMQGGMVGGEDTRQTGSEMALVVKERLSPHVFLGGTFQLNNNMDVHPTRV